MMLCSYIHLYLHALTLYYYRYQPKIDSETLYPQVLAVILLVVAAVGIEVIGNNDNLQFARNNFGTIIIGYYMCLGLFAHQEFIEILVWYMSIIKIERLICYIMCKCP